MIAEIRRYGDLICPHHENEHGGHDARNISDYSSYRRILHRERHVILPEFRFREACDTRLNVTPPSPARNVVINHKSPPDTSVATPHDFPEDTLTCSEEAPSVTFRHRRRVKITLSGNVTDGNRAGPRTYAVFADFGRIRCAHAEIHDYLSEEVRLFLPFFLRRDMTARPSFVAIRARKPCLLIFLRLEGWNVRFIDVSFRCSMGVG